MFEKHQRLDVTADEIAVIQAALHTQAKILNDQASAGGNGARRRLNEVKQALAHISRQTDDRASSTTGRLLSWLGLSRASG